MAEQTSRLAVIIDSTGAEKNAESLTSSLHGLTEWGVKAAASAGKVTKASKEESQALSQLLDRIDPVNAALNKLDEQQKQLAKFKAKGFLDSDTFDLYAKKIDETRTKLTGITTDMGKAGMSAKQMANNMRMLPAQMTDIVVGLSTGQSPFMVLMQQGGQLKDIFGGIGPAIKAVGGYIVGLINPLTLAAGAVGALGYAYYQGSKEQNAFNQSLIMTGNIAGKTAGQLSDIAQRVSVATNATTGNAASVLNQLVSSGKVAGNSLESVTTAITNMSETGVVATEQLISEFDKISVNPIQAITELNDKYHFLTQATYNQIKALQDEGNQQEAARLATETYANAVNEKANLIKGNLGALESAWKFVADAAKSAWDAMMDVGRTQGPEARITEIRKRLDWIDNAAGGNTFFGGEKSKLQQELATLQSMSGVQEGLTEFASERRKAEDEAIKTQQAADRANQQFMSNAEKRNKAIQEQKKFLDAGAISAEKYAQNVSRINEMYKDPKKSGKGYTEDASTKLLDQLNQQSAALQGQLAISEKVGSAQQALIKWEQQLADIKTKKTLTADQKSLLANQEQITAQLQKNAALEKEISLRKDAEKLTAYSNNLSSNLSTDAANLQDKLNSNTVLSQEQKRQQEIAKIVSSYQKKQTDLTNQRTTGQISDNLYQQETAALQAALEQRLVMQQNYYAQLDQLNSNWQMGVVNGLQSYMNSIPTLYESVTTATTSILTSTQNAISSNLSAMIQGAESLSDGFKNMAVGMGQAVIDALTKMAAQWLVYQGVQLLVGKTAAAGASTAMIGQATAMSQVAAINAYASAAAIPITGWAMAPIAMASAEAATAPLIAAVSAAAATMTAGAGFKTGGYTGNMGVNSVAGVVHGKEFVFDAASTKKIGVSNLESIHKNGLDATLSKPGFGTGAQNVSNSNTSSVQYSQPISQNIAINGNPSDATIQLVQNAAKQGAQEGYNRVVNDLAAGKGKVYDTLVGGYKTGRRIK